MKTRGLQDTVCTLYELLEGETGEGAGKIGEMLIVSIASHSLTKAVSRPNTFSEFHGLDPVVFRKAIISLNAEGKAQLFKDDEDSHNDGVKFF